MKISLHLCFLVFSVSLANAQEKKIETILQAPETKVLYYSMTEAGSKVMYLPMEFGKFNFTANQSIFIEQLKNVTIAGIDLVYSDFPSKSDFTALNRKRLKSLLKILPSAFADSFIRFRKIRQTAAVKKEDAINLTHGFYIYYRELPSAAKALKEIKKLKEMLATDIPKDSIVPLDIWCWQWTLVEDSNFVYPVPEGSTRHITKVSKKSVLADSLMKTQDYASYDGYDSLYYVLDVRDEGCVMWDDVYSFNMTDSTVSTVFKRHQWKKAMILADVTGSMYPYTGQLLLWLKLTLSDGLQRQFVFFNDGDSKSDAEKIRGKTGGIYKVVTSKYDDVEKKIEEAMRNGSGGDAPENNIEALIDAQNNCVSCDSVVMIADNWAPVKDISLLSLVKKPVKIVLCGVYDHVNIDYLNIARKTGGSLHLMELDIYQLSKMKEGEIIEIKGTKYQVVDGEFKIMSKKII